MSPEEARRAAHIKLGNIDNILCDISEQKSIGLLETLRQDLRFGLRMLLNSRGFALVSVLTLALGIGANTAIFTVVDTTPIRPLPFPNANRLVMVWEHRMPDGERQDVTSPQRFYQTRPNDPVIVVLDCATLATVALWAGFSRTSRPRIIHRRFRVHRPRKP
jgi:hypothetical protein